MDVGCSGRRVHHTQNPGISSFAAQRGTWAPAGILSYFLRPAKRARWLPHCACSPVGRELHSQQQQLCKVYSPDAFRQRSAFRLLSDTVQSRAQYGSAFLHLRPSTRCQCSAAVVEGAQQAAEASVSDHIALTNGSSASVIVGATGRTFGQGHDSSHTYLPEDFALAPGQLSPVDRDSALSPEDVFRCSGCVRAECQGHAGCADMQWRNEQSGYLRQVLTAKVYNVAVETPLEEAKGLSHQLGHTVLLKREDLQPVFSFKLRGAYNKMASLSEEARRRGVICSSAGNHAQGVALAAKHLGCEAVICMPVTTPEIKVAAVRRLGATVDLVGESYQETQSHAQARGAAEGRVFVAPYDDPYTIAGQGTIGKEILQQCSNDTNLKAIFVAIGGGGLIAGIGAYIKDLRPDVQIIGVEPTGANAMAMSLAAGRRLTLAKVDAFADGVAVKQVGAETFRLCRQLVDGCVLVDNSAISAAIKDVFNETRSILEPAGAVAVAGAKAYLAAGHLPAGSTVVAVTSGANMNFDRLRLVSELADVGARTEAMLATEIPERPGAFRDFVDAALDGTDIQVTEFKYRYSAGDAAHILFSVGIQDAGQLAALLQRLNGRGYATTDLSGIEAAQVHLRHLVGGRARSFMGQLPDEHIFQVEFPERAGALKRFLTVVSPRWNVTLFHYRRTGNRSSQVLMGVQLPPADLAAFASTIQSVGSDEFTVTELSEEARSVFNKFIQ